MAVPAPVVVTIDNNTNVAGNRRQVFGTLTFPNTDAGGYPTGGASVDPTFFGLAVLDRLDLEPARDVATGTHSLLSRLVTATPLGMGFTEASGLIQAFWESSGSTAPFDEVTNATDLSDYIVPFTAWGV